MSKEHPSQIEAKRRYLITRRIWVDGEDPIPLSAEHIELMGHNQNGTLRVITPNFSFSTRMKTVFFESPSFRNPDDTAPVKAIKLFSTNN